MFIDHEGARSFVKVVPAALEEPVFSHHLFKTSAHNLIREFIRDLQDGLYVIRLFCFEEGVKPNGEHLLAWSAIE